MNLRLALVVSIALIFNNLNIQAQGQANNWYFGYNAGINFDNGTPTAITNGQINTSEGCSSISDASGNLLFYSDGRTVWNRNHQIMGNADYYGNSGLHGDPSSTSSALIVPHPGDKDLYFIFTVDEPHHQNAIAYPNQGPANSNGIPQANYSDTNTAVPVADDGFNNGFNYSIVDMRLNNGLGDVVPGQKNIHLITYDQNDPEEIKYKCAEKITAVKGADCSSIWVITHFVDSFYAFKIDQNGINTTPVTSTIGPTIPLNAYRRAALGYIKASPDGLKILTAHHTKTFDQNSGDDLPNGGVYFSDFNPTTGQVTSSTALVENVNPYGVEFSANSTKAYATANDNLANKIFQWDLTAPNMAASINEILITTSEQATALQLGPDGRIYKPVIGEPKLAVIKNPNADFNSLEYTESTFDGAVPLAQRNAVFGLPPFIQSFFVDRINIINQDDDELITNISLCASENYQLAYPNLPNASYTWSKNDSPLPAVTGNSLLVTPDLALGFPQTQEYILEITFNDGKCPLIGIANITFEALPDIQDYTYFQCTRTNQQPEFNLVEIREKLSADFPDSNLVFEFYEWDKDNNKKLISNPQNYIPSDLPAQLEVQLVNTQTSCSNQATLTLDINNYNLIPIQQLVCNIDQKITKEFSSIVEETGITFNNPKFYRTEDEAAKKINPYTEDTVEIVKNNLPFSIYLTDDEVGCSDIYEVKFESNTSFSLDADEEIFYCLEYSPNPINLSVTVDAASDKKFTYLWEPSGETTPSINTAELTTHTVRVTDENGCTESKKFTIVPVGKAKFMTKETHFSPDSSIQVILDPENLGSYQYAIENPEGPYQDSPFFNNLVPGVYTVYVKSEQGCGITSKKVSILGLMRFFTPNADGINDKWRILGKYEDNLRGTEVLIFDRFGKMLYQFNAERPGWDGNYNGKPMPSNDYWYIIRLKNNKEIKGHFTLKR